MGSADCVQCLIHINLHDSKERHLGTFNGHTKVPVGTMGVLVVVPYSTVIQSDSAVRRDFTVHFWGPLSVQFTNKNCYLIQSGRVGLGEVFLNGHFVTD